jgi:hypothetical protein
VFDGGNLRNAIAREAYAIVLVPENKGNDIIDAVAEFKDMSRAEFSITEPEMEITIGEVSLPETVIDNDSFYISLALKLAIAHKRFDLIQHIIRYRKVDYTHTDIFFDYAANVNDDKIKQIIFKELVRHKEFLKHLSLDIIKSYKCIVEAYSNFMNITSNEFLLLMKI